MDDKTYTGKIKEIELIQSSLGYDKNVVTIEQEFGREAYIEFRSRGIMKILQNFSKGEYVEVQAWTEGKRSRLGQHYNNIIAKSINRVKRPETSVSNQSI